MKKFIIINFIILLTSSCTKLTEVEGPSTSTNQDNVYASDETAISVMKGIYINMSSSSLLDGTSLNSFMPFFIGLYADELVPFTGVNNDYFSFYRNDLSNSIAPDIMNFTYLQLFTINSVIEGVGNSETLSPAVKNELIGEAKFMRGLYYFYLTNLYGDVPLVVTTDYKTNNLLSRTNLVVVNQQILNDLHAADSLLADNYYDFVNQKNVIERVIPNKWAAKALLARVYLYMGDYDKAESYSSGIINNSNLYTLTSLNSVFKSNNSESIWQLQPVNPGWNTEDGRTFVLPKEGPSSQKPVYLSNELLNSFETNDNRRSEWVDSVIDQETATTYYYSNKYKIGVSDLPVSEYQVALRLSEQFLIRAEAYAQLGRTSESLNDLNAIRNRAGIGNYVGNTDKTSLVKAIMHERQVELFTEWGHRWLDLKRTGMVDSVMSRVSAEKGTIWKTTASLLPLSEANLKLNPNLIQNVGY